MRRHPRRDPKLDLFTVGIKFRFRIGFTPPLGINKGHDRGSETQQEY